MFSTGSCKAPAERQRKSAHPLFKCPHAKRQGRAKGINLFRKNHHGMILPQFRSAENSLGSRARGRGPICHGPVSDYLSEKRRLLSVSGMLTWAGRNPGNSMGHSITQRGQAFLSPVPRSARITKGPIGDSWKARRCQRHLQNRMMSALRTHHHPLSVFKVKFPAQYPHPATGDKGFRSILEIATATMDGWPRKCEF